MIFKKTGRQIMIDVWLDPIDEYEEIWVKQDETVRGLKRMIRYHLDINVEDQVLIHTHIIMKDKKKLSDYKIRHGSLVRMVSRKKIAKIREHEYLKEG